jgi:hypothetical protein
MLHRHDFATHLHSLKKNLEKNQFFFSSLFYLLEPKSVFHFTEMVQYKLNYFNARGRAELTRLVFAAAGQTFEDNRFEREEWPEYKKKSLTGKAPFLEVVEKKKKT